MLSLILAFMLQGQIVFRDVETRQDCVHVVTAEQSPETKRFEMMTALKAIPATASVFTAFRIELTDGAVRAGSGTSVVGAVENKAVVYRDVITKSDAITTMSAGEKSCTTWEATALVAFVALNNAEVDAVLNQYLARLVIDGVQIWPRS
jgi:hypothetical protein